MSCSIVAIDGPSASGKSTVAGLVAGRLGFFCVESGALYRWVTWKSLQAGIREGDERGVTAVLSGCELEFFADERRRVRFRSGSLTAGVELRDGAVNRNVSWVSAVPAVRAWAVKNLRGLVRFGDLVMEGRDIGTAVFPEARHKFFLTASRDERARRRHADLDGAGDISSVSAALERRDVIDSSRATDPLRVPDGAVVIDSTSMEADTVAGLIVRHVESVEN